MPRAIQLNGVDPGNPAELPVLADAGTKLVFVDSTDGFKVKTRNDVGGDAELGGGGGTDIDAGTTAELLTTKRLAPDGAGGVQWVVGGGGGATDLPLSTPNATPALILTVDASTANRVYKVAFDLQAILATDPGAEDYALYRAVVQFKNSDGVVSILKDMPTIVEEGANMLTADYTVVVNGTDVEFYVVGVASPVNWLMEVLEASLISFTVTP